MTALARATTFLDTLKRAHLCWVESLAGSVALASVASLVEGMLRGETLALARLITLVEREGPEAAEALRLCAPYGGKGYRIGFTGPPGSGKSTLVDAMTARLRQGGKEGAPRVGIVAVDPSSPFTGGALLGDRIRMEQHYADPGVFIRSMGTRGGHGGLPDVTQRVATLLEASGKEYVLLETVGVGQTELDVMEVADTVVVVLVPEAGDMIQTMKAGLMEIADVFVVNKADREGAERLAKEIEGSLRLGHPREGNWMAPVVLAQARTGAGVAEVAAAVAAHRGAMEESGELERRRSKRRTSQFLKTVEQRMSRSLHELIASDGELQAMVERIQRGETDPYSAALQVLGDTSVLRRWIARLEE
ncbi:MAG: methylmalonyl Co-A mutase-associated GTPase MeaB [Dehalococcoidia bacterium]|nr:methylmalonyl Co-A mutase-associated GTPase MeaB [Dehalococcoidia bacterium]